MFALRRLAFCHDGLMQAFADGLGQGINVVIVVDLNGLAGCVANDVAIVAPLKMIFQLRLELDVDLAVQVFVKFFQEVFALHCGFAPFRLGFLK